jgi:nucleoside-diphosphate-sugar epimerase
MSAAPTIALMAAEVGEAYTIPFTGDVGFVYVEDAAERFIAAASRSFEGAHVFDLNGTPATVTEMLALLHNHYPDAAIAATGDPMPFPAEVNNGDLEQLIGLPGCRPLAAGIADTVSGFQSAKARGIDLAGVYQHTLGKTP